MENKKITLGNRRLEIVKLRHSGLRLYEIGKLFNITGERVRQIINPKIKLYCKLHNRNYLLNTCKYCEIDWTYPEYINKLDLTTLQREAMKLRKHDRSHIIVLKRIYLIKLLKDKHQLSYREISALICRGMSVVRYHYKNKNEKNS